MTLRKLSGALIILCASLVASAGGAEACEGSEVLFEDNFAELDPSWGNADESLSVRDGSLVLSPEANKYKLALNQALIFDGDYDICVTMVIEQTSDPSNSWGGVIFWADSWDDYYTLNVAANKYVKVRRTVQDRWLSPVDWREVDAVKEGLNETNQLRIAVRGNRATVYVNEVELFGFTGQPPKTGSLVGLQAASEENARAGYTFSGFKVVQP